MNERLIILEISITILDIILSAVDLIINQTYMHLSPNLGRAM